MAYKVFLDAGHGGYDNGATYQGRKEKDDTLDIALAVGEILEQSGIEVGYTRVTDVYDSPVRKAQIANEEGADVFVSLHRNASPNPNTYSGVQTLIYDYGGIKEQMANEINAELAEQGFNNLGLSIRKDLAVLRRTEMPALLVEVGFINTDADNALLDRNFDGTVNAIANGIYKTIMGTDLPAMMPDDILMPPGQIPSRGTYQVQIGLFRNYQNAQNMLQRVQNMGYNAQIIPSGEYYAVRVGNELSLAAGTALENELRQRGFDTLLVSVG